MTSGWLGKSICANGTHEYCLASKWCLVGGLPISKKDLLESHRRLEKWWHLIHSLHVALGYYTFEALFSFWKPLPHIFTQKQLAWPRSSLLLKLKTCGADGPFKPLTKIGTDCDKYPFLNYAWSKNGIAGQRELVGTQSKLNGKHLHTHHAGVYCPHHKDH